jgi:hemerythrin
LALIDPSTIPQVQVAFMNADHAEEARLLNALAEALSGHREGKGTREDVLDRWRALERHTREHFEREDEAMRRAAFHAYPVHAGEHERVLAEMAAEAGAFAERGDAERLWIYVTHAVPAWFVRHIQTMDQVTARFVAMAAGGQR